MSCLKCKKPTSYEFCDHCFKDVIEKRLRKNIRQYNLMPHETLLVIDPFTKKYLKKVLTIPIKVVYKPKSFFGMRDVSKEALGNHKMRDYIKKTKISRVVLPLTMDDFIVQFLEGIVLKKVQRDSVNCIHLFQKVTSEELTRLRGERKKTGKNEKNTKNNALLVFIDALEKEYPGSKFGLYRSITELQQDFNPIKATSHYL